MLSMVNFGTGLVTTGVPDYLIRQMEASDSDTMEGLAAADAAAVVALNANIQNIQQQWTPADRSLAGGGDGHTFIYTVTYTRRVLNLGASYLWQFLNNQLAHAANAGSLNYPLPAPNNTPNTPGYVPGPEAFFEKFSLASAQGEVSLAYNDMVARAIAATGNSEAFCFWQQLAGAAKGTRFMGGIALFKFTGGG